MNMLITHFLAYRHEKGKLGTIQFRMFAQLRILIQLHNYFFQIFCNFINDFPKLLQLIAKSQLNIIQKITLKKGLFSKSENGAENS